jgi:serine protease Do
MPLPLALAAALWFSPGGTEAFHLGDGAEIRAEVVKETPDSVFLDLGFTVLAVPRKEILRREPVAETGGGEEAAPEEAPTAIYRVGQGKEGTVRESVERVADAVVLVSTPSGLGSGFLISPDGHLVTNDHVIQGETQVTVTLFEQTPSGLDRRPVEGAKIVATNAYADLALLKIETEGKDLPFVRLSAGDSPRVGETVFAIGNPRGLERSVSEGILSTLRRPFDGLTYLQTTAQINPGNSGGPLFDLRGNVIGVTNMKFLFSEGLSFAIPVERVKWFLENREAFLFDKENPNSGYRYLPPGGKKP